jgi:hypothetical protein
MEVVIATKDRQFKASEPAFSAFLIAHEQLNHLINVRPAFPAGRLSLVTAG